MADRRKVIPRTKTVTVPRQQKTVVPRWSVLSQSDTSVVMDLSGFRDASGRLDMEKVHRAAKDYPGRGITFAEKEEGVTSYRGKTAFDIRQEEKLNPTAGAPKKEKSTSLSERLKREGKKAAVQQKRKTDKSLSRLRKIMKAIQPRPKTRLKIVDGKKKRVPKRTTYAKTGTKWNGLKPLKAYQYVDDNGRVISTSKVRASKWREVQAVRLQKAIEKPKLERAAKIEAQRQKKLSKTLAKLRQSRAKELRRIRGRGYEKAARDKARLLRQSSFRAALSKVKGYGKTPVGLLLAKDRQLGEKGLRFSKMPGRRGILKTIPRSELYPARGFSSSRPLPSPVSLRGVSGRMGLEQVQEPMLPGSRGQIYSTTKTLNTPAFASGGRGVMFIVDANAVLQNLTVRYPQILRETAISTADEMGRKLLDIVEPYVPKDTGLLYSTAQSNAAQMVGGGIGLVGESPFAPSETFGVTISYNAPYAEEVYFNMDVSHGAAYNRKHGVGIKGEEETARWIEVAFEKESAAIQSLYGEYAVAVNAALERAGFSKTSFGSGAGAKSFWSL